MQIIKITKIIKKKKTYKFARFCFRQIKGKERADKKGRRGGRPSFAGAGCVCTPPHPRPPPPGSAVLAAGGRGGTAVKAARRSRSRSLPPPRTRPSLRSIPALRALRSDLASPYPAAWPAPCQVGLLVTLVFFIYIYT